MPKSLPYHHGDLRSALVERAISTIADEGVEAVSLRALAREIGVSHSAPMRHFATRSELLAAIAREGVEALVRSASRQAEDESLNGVEKLRAMAKGYVMWARKHPAYHLVLRNRDVMRHADQELLSQLAEYSTLQSQTIEQAQHEGWRANDAPARLLLQIVSLTAGLALTATDPIYASALGKRPTSKDLNAAIDLFFSP